MVSKPTPFFISYRILSLKIESRSKSVCTFNSDRKRLDSNYSHYETVCEDSPSTEVFSSGAFSSKKCSISSRLSFMPVKYVPHTLRKIANSLRVITLLSSKMPRERKGIPHSSNWCSAQAAVKALLPLERAYTKRGWGIPLMRQSTV